MTLIGMTYIDEDEGDGPREYSGPEVVLGVGFQ